MATAFKKVSNNGQSTLYADITTTVQTTVTVVPAEATKFPLTGSFWIRVYNNAVPTSATQSELMLVTGVASNVFTVTRNADGLGAYTFVTGNAVRLNIMSEHVSDLNTAVNTIENKLDGTTTGVTLNTPVINTPTVNTPIIRNWNGWQEANETWTYSSVDGPTGVITVPTDATLKYSVGMKVKFTQTTPKYGIITAITSTTMTVYMGTDYTLANAAISANYYSTQKAPLGFPLIPSKWTVTLTDTTQRTQAAPASGTWYNLGSVSISIPIGTWRVSYQITGQSSDTNSAAAEIYITLSTANNTESDSQFTTYLYNSFGTTVANSIVPAYKIKELTLAAKTTYFANTRTTTANIDNIYNRNDVSRLIITAECPYL